MLFALTVVRCISVHCVWGYIYGRDQETYQVVQQKLLSENTRGAEKQHLANVYILIFDESSRTVFEPFSIILHSQYLLSGSTSVLG